jgi:DNA-binding SARP family transcriptional activator/TolB-like protein
MVSVELLGGAGVRSGAGLLGGPAAQRRRVAVLALMAASPSGRITREKLMSYLWPEVDTGAARRRLGDALHALRRALGRDAILTSGAEVYLNPAVVRTDVGEFMAAFTGEDRETAVALYRGPFLDGFFVPDAPEFEHWVEQQRDRLARDYARALEALAEQWQREGDWNGAAARWRSLAFHDPYSSRVTLRLMMALEASGDPAAALRQAEAHELLLRRELGVEPDPAVAALSARIRENRDGAKVVHHVGGERPPAVLRQPAAAPPVSGGAPAVEAASVQDLEPPAGAGRLPPGLAKRRLWHVGVSGALLLAVVPLSYNWLGEADSRPGPDSPILSLAVMPLADISSDTGQEFFADGMTEALITELSRHGDLHVISRHSAMRYKSTVKPVAQIGRELGVDALINGSVAQDGERVRIAVQLLRAATGEHLWGESYNRDSSDVLGVQREIAEAIAREVRAVAGLGTRR